MNGHNTFHLSTRAAEAYESQKVPAIFLPMAERTLDAIDLPTQLTVLDLACGTGVMARAIASRLKKPSQIVGSDINPAMIEVASKITEEGSHEFKWIVSPADQLECEDSVFDMVFCQHGLQFFPNKEKSLAEVRRVLKPGGKLVITCWAEVPPFFEAVSSVYSTLVGVKAAKIAIEPFIWNDSVVIKNLVSGSGFRVSDPQTLLVERRMAATKDAMQNELLATPNEDALKALPTETFSQVVDEIMSRVSQYERGGELVMPQHSFLFQADASP